MLGVIPWYFLCDNASLRKSNIELRMTLLRASCELDGMHNAIEELKATVDRLEAK